MKDTRVARTPIRGAAALSLAAPNVLLGTVGEPKLGGGGGQAKVPWPVGGAPLVRQYPIWLRFSSCLTVWLSVWLSVSPSSNALVPVLSPTSPTCHPRLLHLS